MRAKYTMRGVGQTLEVFEDELTITTKGLMWAMAGSRRGTKTIPFASITAVKLKEAGVFTNGFLQFDVLGARGDLSGGMIDDNTFVFEDSNRTARKVKSYVEEQIRVARASGTAMPAASVADELAKLAELRRQGVLSEREFRDAKRRLLP